MPFPRDHPFSMGIFDGLRHRGFIEGQNLTIIYRDFAPHGDLLSEYAAELVKAQVDLIYGGGGTATHAAQQATKTIPILGFAEDMVGEGLVHSMARPNGNTTGISILATELNGKRLEILIELVPGLHRMGALSDSNTTTDSKLHELQEVARAHNIELSIHQVAKGEEISAAIDAAQASGVTALNVLASPMLFANRQLIMDRAVALRLLAIYEWPELAEAGGFAGYGPRFFKLPEIVARLAVKLFRHPGRATNDVRTRDQSQDREGDRRHRTADHAGPRRQGDRITIHFAAVHESGFGRYCCKSLFA
jgi:putative ABC transport system substrate-binding protein